MNLHGGNVLLTLPAAGAVTVAGGHGLRWEDDDRRSPVHPVRERCWTRVSITITSSTATMTTRELSPGPGAPIESSVPRSRSRQPQTILLAATSGPPVHGGLDAKTTLPIVDMDGAPAARYAVDLPGPQPELLPNLVSSACRSAEFAQRSGVRCDGSGLGPVAPQALSTADAVIRQFASTPTTCSTAGGRPPGRGRFPTMRPAGCMHSVSRRRRGATDLVPFAVTPGRGRNPVTLLLPTFTYLAYANERLASRDGAGPSDHAALRTRPT